MPEKPPIRRQPPVSSPDPRLKDMETWVFDLDNTLYPASANLFDEIDHAAAYRVQKRYFREHGTSLRGLMDNHDMDPGPYLDYVHEVSVEGVKPNPTLDQALTHLNGRKVVFTNASRGYAERVLARLGIGHHFDGIFDIVEGNYVPKPDRSVYEKLVSSFDIDPARAVMVEDVARNLGPAADMGMATVWVITDRPWAHAEAEGVKPDHRVEDLTAWLADQTEL